MARKQRDYKAEERRRNELARQRGFSSRGQQRRRVSSGNVRNLSPEAAKFVIGVNTKGIEPKGFELPKFAVRESDATRAQNWSDIFARSEVAQYQPDNRPAGMSKREYTDAYMAAFVDGPDRYVDVRRTGGSDALKHWFVDIQGYMQADEYESRYGRQH